MAQAAATKAATGRDAAVRRKAAERAADLNNDQQQDQRRPPRGRDSKRGEDDHTQNTATPSTQNLALHLSPGELADHDLRNARIAFHKKLIDR